MKSIRLALLPLSWLYGLVVGVRNWCYDRGVFRVETAGVPVVSVGNIAVGGTGKTPFVEYLLRRLLEKGTRVAVVSRGYKRTTKGMQIVSDGKNIFGDALTMGDEPYQIAQKFRNAIVIVDEQRARGAKHARALLGAEMVLLDDGFQHRALARDLDIVMMDGASLESDMLLPAGRNREPLASLRRAGIVVLPAYNDRDTQRVKDYTDAAVINACPVPKRFIEIRTQRILPLENVSGRSCVAFCGIANPDRFSRMLESLGMNVAGFKAFPDHCRYGEEHMLILRDMIANKKPELVVTTEKDGSRLLSAGHLHILQSPSIYALEITTAITDGEPLLDNILNDAKEHTI